METFTKVNGVWIREVDLVSLGRLMDKLTKVSGPMTSKKAMGRQTGRMDQIMRVSIRQESAMGRVPIDIPMEPYTRVLSWTTMHMATVFWQTGTNVAILVSLWTIKCMVKDRWSTQTGSNTSENSTATRSTAGVGKSGLMVASTMETGSKASSSAWATTQQRMVRAKKVSGSTVSSKPGTTTKRSWKVYKRASKIQTLLTC